jgi:predicted small metal-binding protein
VSPASVLRLFNRQDSAFTTLLVAIVVAHVYGAICFQAIAQKTGTEDAWWAWVPILNVLLLIKGYPDADSAGEHRHRDHRLDRGLREEGEIGRTGHRDDRAAREPDRAGLSGVLGLRPWQGVGVDCDFVARGQTEEEILKKAADHAKNDHGFQGIPPELLDKVRAAIRGE